MNLFTYLLAKKGKNSLLHGDLFSYLLGKHKSNIVSKSGSNIYINDAKKENILKLLLYKESSQDGTPTPVNPIEIKTVKGYTENQNTWIDLKKTGKNILNVNSNYIKRNNNGSITILDDVITVTNSSSTNNAYGWIIPVEINKQITVSFSETTASVSFANVYCRFIDEPISSITDFSNSEVISRTTKNITLTSTTNYLLVYIRVPQTSFSITNLMASYSEDLSFESYKESIIPLPLNNNELVGIGMYYDQYIVDEDGKCYINKMCNKIDSYNGEVITTPYLSTTGGLDIGATIYYVREKSELINLNSVVDIELYEGENNITNSEQCIMDLTYIKMSN